MTDVPKERKPIDEFLNAGEIVPKTSTLSYKILLVKCWSITCIWNLSTGQQTIVSICELSKWWYGVILV